MRKEHTCIFILFLLGIFKVKSASIPIHTESTYTTERGECKTCIDTTQVHVHISNRFHELLKRIFDLLTSHSDENVGHGKATKPHLAVQKLYSSIRKRFDHHYDIRDLKFMKHLIKALIREAQKVPTILHDAPREGHIIEKSYYRSTLRSKRPWMSVDPLGEPKQQFFSIWQSEMRLFPFSNVAYLSSGCSGLLLSQFIVLTLASCIPKDTNSLIIQTRSNNGENVRRAISDVYIPEQYSQINTGKTLYDYALLKLDELIPGKPYAKLAIIGKKYLEMTKPYDFAGFHKTGEGRPTLIHSECTTEKVRYPGPGSVSLPECTVPGGMQGGPAYVLPPKHDYRVFGLTRRRSGIMLFTKSMIEDVCSKTILMGDRKNCKGI